MTWVTEEIAITVKCTFIAVLLLTGISNCLTTFWFVPHLLAIGNWSAAINLIF